MDDPERDAHPPHPAPAGASASRAWMQGPVAALSTLAQIGGAALAAVGRELAAWKPSTERAAFAAQAVLSVALAVALAYALNLSNTWWAAISGFAVMQTSFAASAKRAAHRILGTVLGALLGTIAGPAIGDLPWIFVPLLGVIGGVSVYRAIGSDAGYAWILGGVTALMVTYEAHKLATAAATASFATLRVAEVVVGTLACLAVSGAFHLGAQLRAKRRAGAGPAGPVAAAAPGAMPATPDDTPAVAAHAPSQQAQHAARKLLAWQCALSVSILAALTYVLKLPGFAQAMVTAVAVLILPVSSLGGSTPRPVVERMVHRFAGCLLAGVISVALLPVLGESAPACMLVLSLGVWFGCHVQTGQEGASYVGRQFTIAFIMVFVQDHHWSADPVPALMRLSGILTGVVVLSAVMLATSRLPLARQGAAAG
nr:FUSC family protein [Caballeronia glathei]